MIHSVGIVGYGSFGALLETLAKRFVPTLMVKVYSSRFEPDGTKFFTLADVAQCDVVVLSVPIHAFEHTLQKVLPLMRDDTVIVDVATVKMHTTEVLKRLALGRQYVATHPMWGPESYEKTKGDVAGYRIVVAESTLVESQLSALKTFVEHCGFTVVTMTAEQHDKHLAETLFLTHFVGQVIERGNFNRTDIDTVSFG